MNLKPSDIPADFAVQPLQADQAAGDKATCGTCGLSWDDSIPTSMTPAPSARCPFENFHKETSEEASKRILGLKAIVAMNNLVLACKAHPGKFDKQIYDGDFHLNTWFDANFGEDAR